MITEDHVSFETAKLLKEKGFDEPCALSEFDCDAYKKWAETAPRPITLDAESEKPFRYPVPSIYVAMKWLREVHDIFIAINIVPNTTVTMEQRYYFFKPYKNRRIYNFPLDYSVQLYETYEQACEAAIKYCLENLI